MARNQYGKPVGATSAAYGAGATAQITGQITVAECLARRNIQHGSPYLLAKRGGITSPRQEKRNMRIGEVRAKLSYGFTQKGIGRSGKYVRRQRNELFRRSGKYVRRQRNELFGRSGKYVRRQRNELYGYERIALGANRKSPKRGGQVGGYCRSCGHWEASNVTGSPRCPLYPGPTWMAHPPTHGIRFSP